MKFKIDRRYPLPPKRKEFISLGSPKKEWEYPFADMRVGDGFFIHNKHGIPKKKIKWAAEEYAARNDRKFSIQQEEKGVRVIRLTKPKAPKREYSGSKYPFRTMEIGESFFVKPEIPRQRVANAACAYGKRNKKRFATAVTPNGSRVFRIR